MYIYCLYIFPHSRTDEPRVRLVSTSFLFGEDCANTWINIFLEHLRTPLRLYAGPAAQTRQTVFLVADSFTMGPKCLLSTRNIPTFPEKETDQNKSVVTKITCKKASLKQQECHFPRQFLNLLHYFLVLPSLLFRGGVHFCSPHHFLSERGQTSIPIPLKVLYSASRHGVRWSTED